MSRIHNKQEFKLVGFKIDLSSLCLITCSKYIVISKPYRWDESVSKSLNHCPCVRRQAGRQEGIMTSDTSLSRGDEAQHAAYEDANREETRI